jgi:hypothetical protein
MVVAPSFVRVPRVWVVQVVVEGTQPWLVVWWLPAAVVVRRSVVVRVVV